MDKPMTTITKRFSGHDWSGPYAYAVVRDVEGRMDAPTAGELADFILTAYRGVVARVDPEEAGVTYEEVMEVADGYADFPPPSYLLNWAYEYDLEVSGYMTSGNWDVLLDGIRSTIVQAITDSINEYETNA